MIEKIMIKKPLFLNSSVIGQPILYLYYKSQYYFKIMIFFVISSFDKKMKIIQIM